MSRLTRRRLPALVLMTIAVGFYAFGGILFRPHTVLGASGNGRIAFTSPDDQSNLQVYTMNPDGSDMRQLTSDVTQNYQPVWSPDGTKIAYTGQDFGDFTYQIFVMNADGSHQVDVTNDDTTNNESLSWSPDGSKIAYASSPADFSTPAAITVMNADGSNKTTLATGSSDFFYPAWSPDGTTVAFLCIDNQSVEQICSVGADGNNEQQITNGTTVNYTSVAYSPSGTEFAFTTESTDTNDTSTTQTVGTMNTDSTNEHTLKTVTTWSTANANWSPDGTKVIYEGPDTGEGLQRIYSINTDGSGDTALSPDDLFASTPSWQPVPASDVDGDGILNTTEAAGPNNGDANGDGIADKYQSNVTSIVDAVTGQYVSVQSSCAGNTAVSAAALPTGHIDPAFRYPAGLLSFTISCDNTGDTATVTQYLYGITAQNSMVLRKYNAQTHSYVTIPGTTITAITIGGQTAAKATYQITDGGPFDQDGSANGVVVDPVGLAVPSVGTPNTGLGGVISFPGTREAPLL